MLSFLRKFFTSKYLTSTAYSFPELYEKIGHFPDIEKNYIRALTHSSFTKKIHEKNERLEFLGDVVLGFAVSKALYACLADDDEGTLTKARAFIVNRKNLNKIGTEIGIPKYLRHKLSDKQLEEAPDIIGNAFEALIGAYFLEIGLDKTEAIVIKLLMHDFDAENFHKNITDPKSYLIEWVQSQKKTIAFVHDESLSQTGLFKVSLLIDGEERAKGSGKNKKQAERKACEEAIHVLELA